MSLSNLKAAASACGKPAEVVCLGTINLRSEERAANLKAPSSFSTNRIEADEQDGAILVLRNTGSQSITLVDNSAGSNLSLTTSPFSFTSNDTLVFRYSKIPDRWEEIFKAVH